MGYEKTILVEGSGEETVPRGSSVTVHCTGYGKNYDLTEKFWRFNHCLLN
jgi:peptidylprolyl isomerase